MTKAIKKETLQTLFPEEEPQPPLRLVTPTHWAILVCFAGIFLVVLVWAFLGSIPLRVKGEGLVYNPSHLVGIQAPNASTVKSIYAHWDEQVSPGSKLIDLDRPIVASQEGRVVEIEVTPGAKVQAGQQLVWIQTPLAKDEIQQVAGLLPKGTSEKIKIGMDVQINLTTANPAQFGKVIGKVSALIPVWMSNFENLFPSKNVSKKDHPSFTHLVVVDLIPNPENPSGYQWTSGAGAERIEIGTPVSFYVILEKKKPIDYL